MSDTTENGSPRTAQSRLKGMAKKTVKRLDFAMRRPGGKRPVAKPAPSSIEPESTPAKPASISEKSISARPKPTRPAPAPVSRPARPARPAVKNHGMFMDFAPGKASKPANPISKPVAPAKKSPTPISKSSTSVNRSVAPVKKPVAPAPKIQSSISVERESVKITSTPVNRPTRPKPAPARLAKPAETAPARPVRSAEPAPARPAKLARMAKPARPSKPARLARPARPVVPEPEFDQPMMDDEETNLVTAFDEELEALEGISDDIFDDIDAADHANHHNAKENYIESEIEAEAREFIKEPKPLFEDPLVQLSKVRDEHRHKKEAEAAAEFKEKTKEEAKKASYLAPYTLGGRSPFLTSVNVEKRPLSAPGSASSVANGPMTAATATGVAKSAKSAKSSKSAKSAKSSKTPKIRWTAKNSAESPVKLQAPGSVLLENTYRNQMKQQLDQDAKEIHRRTMMATTSDGKKRRPSLIAAIILTVLLGVGVGAVIYLIFFQ